MAGEHLGGLVVAHLEDALDDVRHRGAGHAGDLGGVGRRRRPGRGAGHPHAGVAQRGGERVGRGGARVVGVAVAAGRGAPVDPQRRDRADDVVGHVVGPPARVVARSGEEAVVVLHAHASSGLDRRRDLPGEGHHVGALGEGRLRLLEGEWAAREVGVSPADEHHVPGGGAADDAGLEAGVGAERLERGGGGEQLGRGGGDDRALAVRVDGAVAGEVADRRHHVPAEVPVPQAGGERRGDGRLVDPAALRGRHDAGDRGRLAPLRQLHPGRRGDRGGLGLRVDREPRQVARTELEAVRRERRGHQRQHQEGGHPVRHASRPGGSRSVASVTSHPNSPLTLAVGGHCARHWPPTTQRPRREPCPTSR